MIKESKDAAANAVGEILVEDFAETRGILVDIVNEAMEAYLTLVHPMEDEPYTLEEVMERIEEKKLSYGLNKEIVAVVVQDQVYDTAVRIAEGLPSIPGEDGRYEYFFNTNPDQKPIILEDGSVDYNTLGKMELCKEGDILAIYYPAVPGTDGINVYGEAIKARREKELRFLRGKGFREEATKEGTKYYANLDGRVELRGEILTVSPVFIVQGDLDAVTGDVKFNGDIVVMGSVLAHVRVKAEGHITVHGHVETATLIAKKNILLKNGMQGAGQGQVFAKGDVSARFFEQTNVVCGGTINANTIMNCTMDAGKEIIVSGKRGMIIGGELHAVEKITAYEIGNRIGLMTVVRIGISGSFERQIEKIDQSMEWINDELGEVGRQLGPILVRMQKKATDALREEKNACLRRKIELEAQKRQKMNERRKLIDERERSASGSIVAYGNVYSGSMLTINGAELLMNNRCKNVTFRKKRDEIHIYTNDGL